MARGVFGGGYDSGNVPRNVIDYITIESTGNAVDFGDLSVSRYQLAACSNGTRGVFGGGYYSSNVNTIDYITIASTGNAIDFGDLSVSRRALAACANDTRGVFGGGTEGITNTIDYITIASTGNAIDFGDLIQAKRLTGACSSYIRGVFGGGLNSGGSNINEIDYITIASTGNAVDFGDLTLARHLISACSDGTTGVFGGGWISSAQNTIDYITITSSGNASDFGDLSVARQGAGACANNTRGVFGGGWTTAVVNTIDYITIASTGNAVDFGDLTVSRNQLAATSDFVPSGGSEYIYLGNIPLLLVPAAQYLYTPWISVYFLKLESDIGNKEIGLEEAPLGMQVSRQHLRIYTRRRLLDGSLKVVVSSYVKKAVTISSGTLGTHIVEYMKNVKRRKLTVTLTVYYYNETLEKTVEYTLNAKITTLDDTKNMFTADRSWTAVFTQI